MWPFASAPESRPSATQRVISLARFWLFSLDVTLLDSETAWRIHDGVESALLIDGRERSMSIDSEIVSAYEAASVRHVRLRLLLEHIGEPACIPALVAPEGLVTRLDALIAAGATRLSHHVQDEEPSALVKTLHEVALEFLDPCSRSA
jgi:hypothetical protein